MEKNKYVVYMTKYSGIKLPKYYVGSTSLLKIKNGYFGSIRSKKYRGIFESELKDNKHLFSIEILSYHNSRKDALIDELRIQIELDVVKSNEYFNESYAIKDGYFGRKVIGKDHPKYGVPNYEIWLKNGGEEYAKNMDINYRKKQSIVQSGKNNGMYGRIKEVVAINVKTGNKIRVTEDEYIKNVDLSGHTLNMLTVIDNISGKPIRINKNEYSKELHLHHNVGIKHSDKTKSKLSKIHKNMITAKDWNGNFHRVYKDDIRFSNGEFGNTTSKRWLLIDTDNKIYKTLNIRKLLKEMGMCFPEKNRIDENGLVSNVRNSKKYKSLNGWLLKCLD